MKDVEKRKVKMDGIEEKEKEGNVNLKVREIVRRKREGNVNGMKSSEPLAGETQQELRGLSGPNSRKFILHWRKPR